MVLIKRHIKRIRHSDTIYHFIKKSISRTKFYIQKKFSEKLTEEDLLSQFKEIGIFPGDQIVVNSSLSKIGYLEDGAKTVVDTLKSYITQEGLIVMPTYPHINSYKYLEDYITYDVSTTPSKNGAITEYFRTSNGVTRSIHPTHPLAAWGMRSEEIMSGHQLSNSPYDIRSPYKKLLDINAKCLLIGVNFDHAIMIRVIDDLYDDYPISPYIPNEKYNILVKGYNNGLIKVKTTCHDPLYSKERNNMAIFPYMKDKIIFGKLGKADTWVFRSKDLFNTQIECSQNEIFPFFKLPLKGR